MARAKQSKKPFIHVPSATEVQTTEVNYASYNPRRISDADMLHLKASIKKYGFVQPLVVQKKGMVLIGGHQRLRALQELCEENQSPIPETVPAVVLDVNDTTAKMLNVTLNKVGGEFDPYKLAELFTDLRADMTLDDIDSMGFDESEVNQTMSLLAPETFVAPEPSLNNGPQKEPKEKAFSLALEFKTVESREFVKAALIKVIEVTNEKTGDVVARALKAISVAEQPSVVK